MLTINNYYKHIESEKVLKKNLPQVLQKGWDYVNQVTKSGKSLDNYNTSDTVKRTVDLYLEKLQSYLDSKIKKQKTPTKKSVATKVVPAKQKAVKKEAPEKTSKPKHTQEKVKTTFVELISDELKFIRRFVNLHEQAKTKNHIRLFLAALQRAITEKRIRITSKFAKEIMDIQQSLIQYMGRFEKAKIIQINISERRRSDYLTLLGKQSELQSVQLIKTYIGIQGKPIEVKKAKNLYNKIARKINASTLTNNDKYWKEIQQIMSHLKKFIISNPIGGELQVEPSTLNGLKGIAKNKKNEAVHTDIMRIPNDVIMSSVDVLNLKFKKLGFTGKWFDFIGNPARNFFIMIFGLPKYGKSILAIDFAGYLARNFGTVLYVAREEGIDDTLQEKLEKAAHPDLFVTGMLPEDLEDFDFVFLDSVTKLNLSPSDIDTLRAKYPNKGFVSVFQTRKDGNFRGSQEFQHDVDSVIEVPERGKAIQFGRYNQGGEMNIFS